MAQQPGNQQSGSRAPAGATIDGATAAAIAAEGELRPPFAHSKAIIQARCTVIIGGTTAVMSAFSRAIISWLRRIIASTSCHRSLPACTVTPAAELRSRLHVLCPASQRAAI